MKKRLFILLVGLMMSCIMFAADNSLEKVKKDGFFVVGLDDTFAPMGFKDEKGTLIGYDIDLANEVAKKLGVTAKFKPCEWDGILFELKSKKIDMVWNGMTITPDREKQAAFSKPYHNGGQIIFSKKEKPLMKISELEGKIVGVQLGSSGAIAVEKNPIATKLKELKKYDTNANALLDLEIGRLDAVVMDSFAGRYANAKKQTLTYSSESFSEEVVGVAFRKEDITLREAIDKALDEMKADGSFDKITKKWFGDEVK